MIHSMPANQTPCIIIWELSTDTHTHTHIHTHTHTYIHTHTHTQRALIRTFLPSKSRMSLVASPYQPQSEGDT
jgi:hypothetical protein